MIKGAQRFGIFTRKRRWKLAKSEVFSPPGFLASPKEGMGKRFSRFLAPIASLRRLKTREKQGRKAVDFLRAKILSSSYQLNRVYNSPSPPHHTYTPTLEARPNLARKWVVFYVISQVNDRAIAPPPPQKFILFKMPDF